MTSLRLWVPWVALALAFLALALGASLVMNSLATRKRMRAIALRHEHRARARPSGPLHHLPRCLCVLGHDGSIALADRRCQSLTRLAIAIERKRLEQKKNGPGATPGRPPIHLN